MGARPFLASLLATVTIAASPAATAQQSFFEQGRDYFLTKTIEGASKHTEALSETPATATIITRDDIERYGFRTVADVLSFAVPGYTASTDRTWDFAGGRGLTLFEDFNTRLLVTLDGHPMNEPWNNFVGIGREMLIPLELVERIEIIHGPSALLYGGYSLYGLVNVVTSSGDSLPGWRVSTSAGSFATYQVVASYGASGILPGKSEDEPGTAWNIFAAGGYYRSSGERLDFPRIDVGDPVDFFGGTIWGGPQRHTDHERAPFAFLKASLGTFSLLARAGYRNKGEVFGKYGTIYASPFEHRRDTKDLVELKWRPQLGPRLEGSVRVFGDRYTYRSQSTYAGGFDYPFVNAFFYRTVADTWEAGGEASFTYRAGVHLLTFGVEYRYRTVDDSYGDVRMDTNAPLSPPTVRSSNGHLLVAYLQEEWRPTSTLSFVLGGTFADTAPGGTSVLPRLAVIYKPVPRVSIKALWGQGFRPPSLYEAGNQVEELSPETMRSAELSLLWEASKGLALNAYAFDSRLSGLIRYHAVDGGGYQSLDDAPAHGMGGAIQARAGALRGYLNIAYARAHLERDGTEPQDLPGSSRWLLSGGASYDFDKLTASLSGRVVGKQELDPAFFEDGSAGDFLEVNARLLWKTRVEYYPVTFSLDVRNLFDKQGKLSASPSQVLSYVPIPGRSVQAGCEIRF